VVKKRLVPGLEAPLDPFRAGSGMSDDDVGLDREREATLVNIGRQPSVYFSKQRGACTLARFADCAAQRRTGEVTEYNGWWCNSQGRLSTLCGHSPDR